MSPTSIFSTLYKSILNAESLRDTFYNLLNNTLGREVFRTLNNKHNENTIVAFEGQKQVAFKKMHLEGKTHIAKGEYYIPCNPNGRPELCIDINGKGIFFTAYRADINALSLDYQEFFQKTKMLPVKIEEIYFQDSDDRLDFISWVQEYKRLSNLIDEKQLELEELNTAILELPFEEILPFGATTPIEVRALREAYSECINNTLYNESMLEDSYKRYLQIEKEKEEILVLI